MNEITLVIHKTSAVGWSESLERRYCEQSSSTQEQSASPEVVGTDLFGGPDHTAVWHACGSEEAKRLLAKLSQPAQTISDEEPGATRINGLL